MPCVAAAAHAEENILTNTSKSPNTGSIPKKAVGVKPVVQTLLNMWQASVLLGGVRLTSSARACKILAHIQFPSRELRKTPPS